MSNDTIEAKKKVDINTPIGKLSLEMQFQEKEKLEAARMKEKRKLIQKRAPNIAAAPYGVPGATQESFDGPMGGESAPGEPEQEAGSEEGESPADRGKRSAQEQVGQGNQKGNIKGGASGTNVQQQLAQRGGQSSQEAQEPQGEGQQPESETVAPEEEANKAEALREQQLEAQRQQEAGQAQAEQTKQAAAGTAGEQVKAAKATIVKKQLKAWAKKWILKNPAFWIIVGKILFWGVVVSVAIGVILILPCESLIGRFALKISGLDFGQCEMFGASSSESEQQNQTGIVYVNIKAEQEDDQSGRLTNLLKYLGSQMRIEVHSVSDDGLFTGACTPWDTANPGACAHTLSPVISAHYGGPTNTVTKTTDSRKHSPGFSCAADIWNANIPGLVQLLSQVQSTYQIIYIRCEASGDTSPVDCNSGGVGHVHVAVSGCGAK